MITKTGQSVEFFLASGNYSDTTTLKIYDFDPLEGAILTGDKAYNNYDIEDAIR